MIERKQHFLIDSNSLMTPYNTYYPFDFAERFWIQLQEKINSGDIIILDMVFEEVKKGEDDLSDWIDEINQDSILSRNNMQIIDEYGKVLNYLHDSDLYQEKALTEWSQASVADPWLIAAAKAYNYDIVTFEKHHGNLNERRPTWKVKIPDVADKFGVKYCDLYHMMRVLGIGL